MILSLPALIYCTARKRVIIGGIIGLLALFNLAAVLSLYAPQKPPQDLDYNYPLKLLAFNNCAYDNHDYARTEKLVKESAADVVAIIELDDDWKRELPPRMKALGYPHQALAFKDNCGLAVFSKLAIKGSRLQMVEGELAHPYLVVDLSYGKKPGETLRLIAAHTAVPQRLTDRRREFKLLAEECAAGVRPLLICGDFNCTPWAEDLNLLLRHGKLRNASQGHGPLPTWHSALPLFPIDHVLVNDRVRVDGICAGDNAGSDHRALLTEVGLPRLL